MLEQERPSAALLDANLGNELVPPVAKALKAKGVFFVIASAYDRPGQYGGEILNGVPNVGKPPCERRLFAALARLTGA